MKSDTYRRPPRRATAILGAAITTLVVLAGCASTEVERDGTESFTPAEQDASAPLLVWVDSTRLASAEQYQNENPDVKMNIVTYDGQSASLQTKITLMDRAGEGWPDIVFSGQTSDSSWASAGQKPFAAPLNDGIIPDEVISQFAQGSLEPCTVGDTLYCIRNDVAQNVFWYDQELFDQFDYEVPSTWEELQELSDRVAAENPGYILGSAADFAPNVFFFASECPANQLDGTNYTSDLSSSNCTRAAHLMDHMIGNGTLATESVFSAEFAAKYGSRTLALPGPSWYGQYIFEAALEVPAGRVAAGAPLAWGDGAAVTGNVGGGTWFISSHSKNLDAASKMVQWLTTSNDVQASAPTYPAYTPAAEAWLQNPDNTSYFAGDVGPVLKEAATVVWPGWSLTSRVDPNLIWNNTVFPEVLKGTKVVDALRAWQDEANNQAVTFGYQITTG